MAVSDFIVALESDNSRLAKEAVVKRASTLAAENPEAKLFLIAAQLAYDPYSKWGVKKVDEINTGRETTPPSVWPEFFSLLDALKNRTITGNAARDAIIQVSQRFSDNDWNLVCRRVLIKDLRCGVTATTLNKFVPNEFKIPGFGCQLAVDGKESIGDLTGQFRLENKLDGVRMLAIYDGSSVTLTSRNGKDLENFPKIAEAIQEVAPLFKDNFPDGFVLDGEVMGESFQALMKQARRKSDVETTDMIYHVFDVIDLPSFKEGLWKVTQRNRSLYLEDTYRFWLEKTGVIQVSSGIYVDLDTEEGHATLHDYFAEAISAGYEGIMIKDVRAFYETKRTKAWLKKKPTATFDLTVVGVEGGTGRNMGRLGALVCEGEDDDKMIRVNVGSGFSDELREDIWSTREVMVGQVVEVMADAVTQNQDGSYSLRFPRFVRFRGFEAGEKL